MPNAQSGPPLLPGIQRELLQISSLWTLRQQTDRGKLKPSSSQNKITSKLDKWHEPVEEKLQVARVGLRPMTIWPYLTSPSKNLLGKRLCLPWGVAISEVSPQHSVQAEWKIWKPAYEKRTGAAEVMLLLTDSEILLGVLHGITRWLPIAYTLCTKFVSERNRVGVSTGKMHLRSLTHFLPQKATCKDYSCMENDCRSCPIWLPLLRKTWGGWTPRTTSVSPKGPSYFNVDYESTCNRTSLAGVHFFLSIQPCRWTLQDYFDHGQCPQSEQAR